MKTHTRVVVIGGGVVGAPPEGRTVVAATGQGTGGQGQQGHGRHDSDLATEATSRAFVTAGVAIAHSLHPVPRKRIHTLAALTISETGARVQ